MTTMTQTTNLHAASQQWFSRPDDQRFLSLEALKESVENRRRECWTATPSVKNLRVVPTGEKSIELEVYDPTQGEQRLLAPTHWAFGQLAQYAKAPAAYLRQLPAELASINLQWGLEFNPLRPEGLVLARSNGDNSLRSMTSTSYGRIWDSQVVNAVIKANHDGRWQIPAASYSAKNPKRATTLYASDRDVFIFLVDPEHPVEVNGETLFRGFYTWNSEVGSATFGLCTFLYRFVCDNRIIWGASDVQELKIRHTGGAPERFAYEGARYLKRYAEESTLQIETQIKRAQGYEIPKAAEKGKVEEWLQKRGFTGSVAKSAVTAAQAEEGQARSLWDIVNGITAHARSLSYTDERVALERQAGKLLEIVKN